MWVRSPVACPSSAVHTRPMSKHIASLNQILANTYALAVKTHAAHWNVTGAQFFSLHAAFGEQYEALFEAADDLAERLRALGEKAPAGLRALAKASDLDDTESGDGLKLVQQLHADHAALAKLIKAGIAAADKAGDEATADLLTGRLEEHDQTAWMLKATLG
jgi:starvation-inducible DNA-binding protein